jgi:hypothetical protein
MERSGGVIDAGRFGNPDIRVTAGQFFGVAERTADF